MPSSFFARYFNNNLSELSERAYKEYYTTMEKLCNKARAAADRLFVSWTGPGAVPYLLQCNILIDTVKGYMLYRKDVFFPYMKELAEKNAEGHDCANCAGNCNAGHKTKVAELAASHEEIKLTLDELHAIFPEEGIDISWKELKALQIEMLLMEQTLAEIRQLEELVLIPKIIEAQNKINANDQGK